MTAAAPLVTIKDLSSTIRSATRLFPCAPVVRAVEESAEVRLGRAWLVASRAAAKVDARVAVLRPRATRAGHHLRVLMLRRCR